ncbi:MAG: hypothetical protein NTU44_01990 [Bacteroidetes bacterium]|nr:hypothetical protein [Bacteroidota bacterium]
MKTRVINLFIVMVTMASCTRIHNLERVDLKVLSVSASKYEHENKIIEFEIKNNLGETLYITSFDSLPSSIGSIPDVKNDLTVFIPNLQEVSHTYNPPSEGSFPNILATDSAADLFKYYKDITSSNNKFIETDENGKTVYKIPSNSAIRLSAICTFFPDELVKIDTTKLVSSKIFPRISLHVKYSTSSSKTYQETILVSAPERKLNYVFF